MMHQITLESDSQQICLSGPGALEAIRGARLGAGEPAGEWVREAIDLELAGSPAQIEAALEGVGRLLRQARAAGEPETVYLGVQVTPEGAAWRSPLCGGRVEALGPGAGLRSRGSQGARLVLLRAADWEGPETQAALSNGNAAATLEPLPVLNANDGAGSPPAQRHNYADIAAGAVGGDLLAAARLEITNRSAQRLYDVWIGQNWTAPANCGQVYEAEAAAGASPTPADTCSGGAYVRASLASGSEQALLAWPLPGPRLDAAAGQWVHALVRFAAAGWETYARFRLKILWNLTTLWQSDWVQPDAGRTILLRDLFQFRLPPNLAGLNGLDALDLVLSGQQASGAAQPIDIDFLALVPADGWRYLTCNGYGIEPGGRIVDDGIEGRLFADDGAGGGRTPVPVGYGHPIGLLPGRAQRLYFWQHTANAHTAPLDQEIGVKLFFRPRRQAL